MTGDDHSEWEPLQQIPNSAVVAARLVIAGHAQSSEDARLLMQACGLIDDPLIGRWTVRTNRHRSPRKE